MVVIIGWIAQISRTIAGSLLFSVALPIWIFSLIVATLGLIDLAKSPDRQIGNSQIFAVLTLIFGGLLGFVMVPAMIHGVGADFTGLRTQRAVAHSGAEPLDFRDHNFVFYTPSPPWQQAPAKALGQNTVVAFTRPDPMYFKLVVDRIELMLLDPRKHVAELSKTSLRQSATYYHLVNEREATYNGLAGWQTETELSLNGHDFYCMQWVFATNGFGYQLTSWAPATEKTNLLQESRRMFADFELTAPQK